MQLVTYSRELRFVQQRIAPMPSSCWLAWGGRYDQRGAPHDDCAARDPGRTGSYPAFARKLRRLRPAPVRDPLIRFETDPGVQTQADWAQLGIWPLGEDAAERSAMVTILGCSRAPAIRFATDRTRQTSLACLTRCLDDLGGTTREILTDRDPACCVGARADGGAILAPEWLDLCDVRGVVPKACRPYRAQTKGKVERMVRELKESLLPWLGGQVLPRTSSLSDYDALARRWIDEVVLQRKHRTTGRVVGDAWSEERRELTPIPARILAGLVGDHLPSTSRPPIELAARRQGEVVEVRELAEYEVAR
jgi:transposase